MRDTVSTLLENQFNMTLPNFGIKDGIEILILSVIIYYFIKWLKDTRAWSLLKGMIVIGGVVAVAYIFQMTTILWLAEKFISVGLIALAIIFQPELRRALERLGRKNYVLDFFGPNRGERRFSEKTVDELVEASFEMGKVKTGALIVLEKYDPLNDYVATGIEVDALLTRQLLINIFEKNTPLHDGAVVVRGDRVVAATCYLPLSDDENISKDLGTRHRAAVGASENTDSLTIIVSEETGAVSVAEGGVITRRLTEDGLRKRIENIAVIGEILPEKNTGKRFFGLFGKVGKGDSSNENSEEAD